MTQPDPAVDDAPGDLASDLVGAYLRTRDRMCDLLSGAGSAELAATVPACPGWKVRELLAHVVSMPVALAGGRRPSGPVGEWLDELIAERVGEPACELADEWRALDREIAAVLNGGAGILFGDLGVHEHDLRGALGAPDHGALEVAELLPRTLAGFRKPLAEAGLGPIVVDDGQQVWRSHEGPGGWTLLVDPWTAVRAVNSRRTADELRALPARGDADPYLAILDAHLPLPPASLGES